jgi:hypothetical protein
MLVEILPPKQQTHPMNWSKRAILKGIFYQLKSLNLDYFRAKPMNIALEEGFPL